MEGTIRSAHESHNGTGGATRAAGHNTGPEVVMSRRVIHGSAAVLLAMAAPLVAAAQTVDDIVARHVAARGGYERLQAIKRRGADRKAP